MTEEKKALRNQKIDCFKKELSELIEKHEIILDEVIGVYFHLSEKGDPLFEYNGISFIARTDLNISTLKDGKNVILKEFL